jgi:hypothetical protein
MYQMLFRQKFAANGYAHQMWKSFSLPIRPYVGLVLREKGEDLLVIETIWDVDLHTFVVDLPTSPIDPKDLSAVIEDYKKRRWLLESEVSYKAKNGG